STALSYGATVGPKIVRELGGYGPTAEVVAIALLSVAAATASFATLRFQSRNWMGVEAAGLRLDLFWAGASIFIGTFLLGSNFEYRLVFLMLTVPQLLTWSARRRPEALLARTILIAMALFFWLKSYAVVEVLDWVLFAGLLTVL